MSKVFTHGEIGKQLSEILGIKYLVDASIHFPLGDFVKADVTFYVDDIQAKAILQLCKDGKWRSPHAAGADVDTTTLDSTSRYRTYTPGPEAEGNG